jgi:regulator of replication initiation timing
MKKLPTWVRDDGSIVACTEKIKVMKENFHEIKQIAQDAFEDGILLEVSETQMRETLHQLVEELMNPYQKKSTPKK